MDHIGYVKYTIDRENNCLNARYASLKDGVISKGTGIAIGESYSTFPGKYRITYFDVKGIEVADQDLIIKLEDGQYVVQWISNGKLTHFGIGTIENEVLIVGYRRVS